MENPHIKDSAPRWLRICKGLSVCDRISDVGFKNRSLSGCVLIFAAEREQYITEKLRKTNSQGNVRTGQKIFKKEGKK